MQKGALNHIMSERKLGKKRLVYSKPKEELPIQNAKYVKNCLELYLGSKNIDILRGFDVFANLEVLWLNDNNISNLRGLEENFRLKELYLHKNKLTTLKGIRLPCIFLKRLTLYENKISDLNAVIECLSKLRTLEQLELQNNPCAEEPNYRLRVINACPSVRVFDSHVVTDTERKRAAILHQERLKAERRAKAESIRSSAHGSLKGNSRRNDGSRAGDSRTSESLVSRKTKQTAQDGLVYNDLGNNVSGTVKILYRELARISREEKKQEEANERANYAKAMQALEDQKELSGERLRQAVLPKAINFIHLEGNRSENDLGAWQIYRLRKLFEAHDEDGSGELDLAEVKGVLTEMEDYGWVLSGDSEDSVNVLFAEIDQDKSGKVTIEEFVLGMQEMMKEQNCNSRDDDGDNLSIQWVILDAETAWARSRQMSRKAGYVQAKALALPDSDDRKDQMMREAVELSRRATRLRIVAEKQTKNEEENTQRGGLGRGLGYDTAQLGKERSDWVKYYHCEFSAQERRAEVRGNDSESDDDYEESGDDFGDERTPSKMNKTAPKPQDADHGFDINSLANKVHIERLKNTLKKDRQTRRKLRSKFGLTEKHKDFKKFAEDRISQGGYDLSEHISEI